MDKEELLQFLDKEKSKIKFRLSRKLPYYEDIEEKLWDVVGSSFEFSFKIKNDEKLPVVVRRITNGVMAGYYEDPDNHRNNRIRVVSLEEFDDFAQHRLEDNQPDRKLERKELVSAVQRTISLLKPSHAAVLSLKELEGYSYKEIANCLGISVTQVRGRLYRARKEFKKLAIKGNLREFLYQ